MTPRPETFGSFMQCCLENCFSAAVIILVQVMNRRQQLANIERAKKEKEMEEEVKKRKEEEENQARKDENEEHGESTTENETNKNGVDPKSD
ncbi:unnamed protein product [Caenorhabditis nigoni]